MNTRKLSAFAAKYKYVLIILLVGLILLLLPTGSKTKVKTAQASPVSEQTQTQTIQAEEQRLTQLLQQINGAGQVQVLLSYRSRRLRRGRLAAGAARRHAGSGTVYRPEYGPHFRAQKAAGFAI